MSIATVSQHARELARAAERSGAALVARTVATVRADLGVTVMLLAVGALAGFVLARL